MVTIQQADPVAVVKLGLERASEVGDGTLLEGRKRLRVHLLLLDPGLQVAIVDGLVERRHADLGIEDVVACHDLLSLDVIWLEFLDGWNCCGLGERRAELSFRGLQERHLIDS